MHLYDSVLFDFDGVILDTEPVHWACYEEVLKPHGIALDWETYEEHCVGMADFEMLDFLGARANPPVDGEVLKAEYGRKNELFLERMLRDPALPPDTRQLVEDLRREGLRLAIVSSSGRAGVEPILKAAGLLEYFQTTVCSDDVTNYKPHPEPYELAAARLGALKPLVVEDSDAGIASAKAAGFDFVRIDKAANTARLVRERVFGPVQ